ncbi:MAG: Gfo/Idh/MocA family oxidoreductase [bacterium]
MVNIGIIGYGHAGRDFAAQAFKRIAGIKVTAIATNSTKTMARAKEDFPAASVFTTHQALLEAANVQAIAICTEPFRHFPIARAVLASGRDVMLEKPGVIKLSEAETLANITHRSGRLVAVNQYWRFTRALNTAKDLLAKGAIGEVVTVEAELGNNGPPRDWFYDINKNGGGSFLDLGIHIVDAIRFLFDCEITALDVENMIYEEKHPLTDVIATATLQTDKDISGAIKTSWRMEPTARITINGLEGTMIISFKPEQSVIIQSLDGKEETQTLIETPAVCAYTHFANLLLSGEKDLSGFTFLNNLGSLWPLIVANNQRGLA